MVRMVMIEEEEIYVTSSCLIHKYNYSNDNTIITMITALTIIRTVTITNNYT